MSYKVAVVGATGNVGREMLNVLVQRQFPISEVVALASTRSIGTEVSFGDHVLKVKALDYYDFKGTDIVLMSAGGKISKEWSPKIAAAGALVIDNSSALAYGPRRAAGRARGQRRCARSDQERHHRQSELLHHPARGRPQAVERRSQDQARGRLHLSIGLRRRQGGYGRALHPDARGCSSPTRSPKASSHKQIAFNVIPHIDEFMDSGYTREEFKMMVETQKILDPDIQLTVTCVRVPVFVGHSECVTVEFERPITATKAREILRAAPGVLVVDKREDGGYVSPIECVGEDATFVSRIRKDPTRRARSFDVGRQRQSAQRRGSERGADRGMPDK